MAANRCASLALLSLAIATSIASRAQNLNLNISAQAGYDNTIITSLVDGNGNPLFLSASTSTLTINGTTTPLVLMIAGVYQQLTTSPTLTVTNGSGSPELQFVYALQDLSNSTLQSTDFGITTLAPVYSYTAPTSATGQFWFDLSTNLMKSWNGSAFTPTPAVFLGVIDVTTAPSIDAILCEPYRLNPYRRVELFGTGTVAQKYVNAGSVTAADGWSQYSVFEAYGSTTVVQPPAWTAAAPTTGLIIFSQNPVLIVLGASVNANTKGAPGGTGGTGVGGAGQSGGCAGGGGGGGYNSASAQAGGAGGGRSSWAAQGFFIGAGAGGTSGTPTGTRGQSATIQGSPYTREVMPLACMGAGGGAGAGDGTNNGGGGGAGGGVVIIRAPSILVDSTSTVTGGGQRGVNGAGGTASGGGGGGGGTALLQGIFVNQNGVLASGAGGAGSGGHSGSAGGAGIFATVKLQ